MKKVLIIGSSGQIGSALMEKFLNLKINMDGVDVRPNPWNQIYTTIIFDFKLIKEKELKGYTDIIFLASEPSAKKLESDKKIYEADKELFDYALQIAQKNNIRFVIVSSRELFGIRPEKLSDFNAKNKYEKQKKYFELSLLNQKIIPYGIIRVPIVFGGYDTDIGRLSRLIPRWSKLIVESKEINIENENNKISIIPIDDVADKILSLIVKNTDSFLVEEAGSEVKIIDLLNLIKNTYKKIDKKRAEFDSPLQSAIHKTLLEFYE